VAAFIGISPKYAELVRRGLMPSPRSSTGGGFHDRQLAHAAFKRLPTTMDNTSHFRRGDAHEMVQDCFPHEMRTTFAGKGSLVETWLTDNAHGRTAAVQSPREEHS
jgi:hypothetical protein